jgi:hypothetical protein
MAFENILRPSARGVSQEQDITPKDPNANVIADMALGIPRGVEGFAQSIYDLADYATGDKLLPNYDERFLGKSKTTAGGFVEGTSQFLTGFIPIVGQLGKVSKASKALSAFSKSRPVVSNIGKGAVAGAGSDFLSFQAQEERLSNLIEQFPELNNPVTAYLAADDNDGEIEGRFKNVIEGLFIEAGMVGLGTTFTQAVKAIKKTKKGNLKDSDVQFNSEEAKKNVISEANDTDTVRNFSYNIYGADVENKKIPLSDWLGKYTENFDDEYADLAKTLLGRFRNSLDQETITIGSDVQGRTTWSAGDGVKLGNGGIKTVIHETMHSLTSRTLMEKMPFTNSGAEFKEQLNTILNTAPIDDTDTAIQGLAKSYLKVVDALKVDKQVFNPAQGKGANIDSMVDARAMELDLDELPYGLTNLHEFVAEAFTNREFQKTLAGIQGEGAGRNVFSEILDYLKQVMGLTQRQGTVLDDVFVSTGTIAKNNEFYLDQTFSLAKQMEKFKKSFGSQDIEDGVYRSDNEINAPKDEVEGIDYVMVDGVPMRFDDVHSDLDSVKPTRYADLPRQQLDIKDSFNQGDFLDEMNTGTLRSLLNGNAKTTEGNPIVLGERNPTRWKIEAELRQRGKRTGDGEPRDFVKETDSEIIEMEKSKYNPEGYKVINDGKNTFKKIDEMVDKGEGVSALGKIDGQFTHYGNPWSHLKSAQKINKRLIPAKSLKESTQNYKDWLEGKAHTDVAQDQREWILKQIDSGKLDDKAILYNSRTTNKTKELGSGDGKFPINPRQNNHAVVLANFRNQRRKDNISFQEKASTPKQGILNTDQENYLRALVKEYTTKEGELDLNLGESVIKAINDGTASEYIDTLRKIVGEDKKATGIINKILDMSRKVDIEKTVREEARPNIKANKFRELQRKLMRMEAGVEAKDPSAGLFAARSQKSYGDEMKAGEQAMQDLGSFQSKADAIRGYNFGSQPTPEDFENTLDAFIAKMVKPFMKDLKTGGAKALKSAAKNIESSTGAVTLISAVAKNLDETGTKTTVTEEELIKETKELLDLLGGKEIDHMKAIETIKANGTSLESFRNEQKAIKQVIQTLADTIVDTSIQAQKARKADSGLNREELEVQVLSLLDQLTEANRIWSLQGKEAGLTLVQRKFLKGGDGFSLSTHNRKVGYDFNQDTRMLSSYKDNIKGSKGIDELIDTLAGAKNVADVNHRLKMVNTTATSAKGNQLFNVINEYWINSLLSGPTTQIVNILGNSMTTALRFTELAVGSVLNKDTKLARSAMSFAFNIEAFSESLRAAVIAGKENRSIITQSGTQFKDTAGYMKPNEFDAIRSDDEGAVGQAINAIGAIVRFPSRMLQAGDEFFKQLNYRAYVRTDLAMEAMEKYKMTDGKDIAEYVNTKMNDYITEGGRAYNEYNLYLDAEAAADKKGLMGRSRTAYINAGEELMNFDAKRGKLADEALQRARVNTFTNDLDSKGAVDTVANFISTAKERNKMFAFIVPFVRTPTNILKFSLARSPLGLGVDAYKGIVNKESIIRQKLNSKDPRVVAETKGQLATASTFVATAAWYMTTNKDWITGAGPTEKAQNEAWKQDGKTPYSIKVGNTWVSYQRLDPFSTIIGIIADTVHAADYNDFDNSDTIGGDLQTVLSALGIAVVNNVTNKSYVKGLDSLVQAFKDPEANFSKIGKNIAGGFMPTFVSQMQNVFPERELKETRTLMDAFLKKVPYNNVPNKRNFLGETVKITNPPIIGAFNPLYMNPASHDSVDKEIARLGHGFNKVNPKLYDSIDLRDIQENGRQGYDRLLEIQSDSKINGMTQRQALRKLINSAYYKALPESDDDIGMKSPKVRAINKVLKSFRTFARSELLKEFPELRQQFNELAANRNEYRTTY